MTLDSPATAPHPDAQALTPQPPAPARLGTLHGVSLGPGDPGLITRLAWAQLTRPGVHWTYPVRSTRADSYAAAIVQRAGLALPESAQALLFPMTHDAEKLARHWHKAAESVAEVLRQGRDVLFLVEGDASTYATFGHLASVLAILLPEAPIEVIPGVPSFTASCARLRWPLAEQDDTVAIVPAAYGIQQVRGLLPHFDTLVLMKVKPLLDELVDLLDAEGLLATSCFIEKAGSPEERIVRDVASLRGQKVNYLSLMVVRQPGRAKGERIKGCKPKSLAWVKAAQGLPSSEPERAATPAAMPGPSGPGRHSLSGSAARQDLS